MLEKRPFFIHPPEESKGSAKTGSLSGTLALFWHGAGGDVDERTILSMARAFAKAGAFAVRARFAYRVANRKAPDRMPVLMKSARATINEIKTLVGRSKRVILGGRSMGGRVASMLAAEGDAVDGLLFLAYPLHPEGQPDKLRDEHLYGIRCPMLFLHGDKDALALPTLLDPVLERLGTRATTIRFPGADHSLRQAPLAKVVDASVSWAESLSKKR